MSDQDEVGRPNYGSASGAAARGSASPPEIPVRGAPLALRAIAAAALSVFAWSTWTDYYRLPHFLAVIAAYFAMRLGKKAVVKIDASRDARSGRFLADTARFTGLLFLVFTAMLTGYWLLDPRFGVKSVLNYLLH